MKKTFLLVFLFAFLGCESPKKFNWDEILNGNDEDAADIDATADQDSAVDEDAAVNTDSDSVIIPDSDVIIDNDVADVDDYIDDDVQIDSDFNDIDELTDADSDSDADSDIDADIIIEPFCGDGTEDLGEVCDKAKTYTADQLCDKDSGSRNYYENSVASCDADCQGVSGNCYYCGDGIETDPNELGTGCDSGKVYTEEELCDKKFGARDYYSASTASCSASCAIAGNCYYCGDGVVSNGEVCDGNTTTCSNAGVTGSSGTATCKSDCSGWVTFPSKCTRSSQTCTGLPGNAVWNTVSSIIQTWTGTDWTPTTAGVYNTSSSTTQCRYKCAADHHLDGASCVSNTRINQSCTGLIANASWNTVSSITQTWSGSSWTPTTAGTYNITSSGTECRYTCNATYHWAGSACVSDTRTAQSCTGLVSNASWNTVSTITQTWNGSAWTPTTSASYNTAGSTTECRFQCSENYNWSGSACNAATQPANCPAKPITGTVWNDGGKNGTYTQTWNGSIWAPTTNTTYNTTSGDCRYKCDTNLYFNGSICVAGSTTGAICTGQTKCYNDTVEITCPTEGSAFYGQDVQYVSECLPRSYTVSGTAGADVVTDNNTGLIWQRTLPSTYSGCNGGIPVGSTCTWQEAINYCDGLSYAGQTDWRLPTSAELDTLPDYGKSDPSIDTSVFFSTQSGFYWSSTQYVGGTTSSWYTSFSDGILSTKEKTTVNGMYARCVRGLALPASSFTESTVSGKVIVTDTTTGLIWQKEYSTLNWINALSYCETSNYAGYTDWRLPNIGELITLIDDSKSIPASSFPGVPSSYFWSSSSYMDGTTDAWSVNFIIGSVGKNVKTKLNYARCVR